MKFSVLLALLVSFAGIAAFPACAAGTLPVEEIVARASRAAFYAGSDGIADVRMTITDARGRQRQREMRILRKDVEEGGEQKFFVYFTSPADVARTVFMVWKHPGRDDDRWLYLPAMDLVRRISAADKRSQFVGSHFVYEDISGRALEADSHELVSEEGDTYLVRNVPLEKKGAEFAWYHVWIDKVTFMPVKAEYHDAAGTLLRRITAQERKDVQGHPTVIRSQAEDLRQGGSTLLEFRDVRYDVGLEDDIFEERYLRRPPVQWVK